MKRLFLTLLCLLIFCGIADARMLQGIAGSVTTSTANFCDGTTSILCEDFETTGGSCGDDANTNCRASWTGVNGTFNNQNTGLSGSYSKLSNATSDSSLLASTYVSFSSASSIYTYAIVNINTITITGNSSSVVGLSGTTAACFLSVNASKAWTLASSGTGGTAVGTSPSTGTNYAIWLEYTNNTANTGCSVYIAEATCADGICSATKPALTKGITTNNSGNVDKYYLGARDQVSFGDVDIITADNIRINSSSIGDDGGDQ